MNIDRLKYLAGLRENKAPKHFFGNIEEQTLENEFYRKVLFTGPNLQLVVMSIPAGEEIGEEIHEDGDQFIRIESGTGLFTIGSEEHRCNDGDSVVIPQGTRHNVINRGSSPLQLYAIYSPPEHKPGTEQENKQ